MYLINPSVIDGFFSQINWEEVKKTIARLEQEHLAILVGNNSSEQKCYSILIQWYENCEILQYMYIDKIYKKYIQA